MKKNLYLLLFYIGLTGAAGFVWMCWITAHGAGVSPDSTTYIGGAKSLLAGAGYALDGRPITQVPPLYPVFLAASGFLVHDLVEAARFLNAVLFGINAALAALIVYLSAGRNLLTTTLAVLFLSASAAILELHAWAWSEPLFLALSLACIILLSLYVTRPDMLLLFGSALLVGGAIVTRYAGGAFLAPGLGLVFAAGAGCSAGRRVRNALIWLLLACTPLVIVTMRNKWAAGTATNRSFVYHPLSIASYVRNVNATLFNFIAPVSTPGLVLTVVFGLLAAALLVLLIILFKEHLRDIHLRSLEVVLPITCFLFSASYLVFLLLSISFFDAATAVDGRILSPVFFFASAVAFAALWRAAQIVRRPVIWEAFLLTVLLSLSIKAPDAIKQARTIHNNGLGYSSPFWRTSESVVFVKSLEEKVRVYSNGADVLSFLSERNIPFLPRKFSTVSTNANPLYEKELMAMCKDIQENGALLVYFKTISWRVYFPTQDELASACKLPILHTFSDGTVYGNYEK